MYLSIGRYPRRGGLEPTKVSIEMSDRVVQCDLRAELEHDGLRLDELAHPDHVLHQNFADLSDAS